MAQEYAIKLNSADSQYLGVADHADLDVSTFTIEAWVKQESIPSEYHIAGKWRTTDNNRSYRFMIDTTGTNLRLDTSSAGTAESQATAAIGYTLSVETWYHLAVTKTGTTTKFYINGKEYAAGGTTESTIYNGAADFRIGANSNTTAAGFIDGYIKDVRLFNDVRTQSEIVSDAFTESVSNANLVAEYNLNNALTDTSGNSHTLTASGSPVFSVDIPWHDENGVESDIYCLTLDGSTQFAENTSPTGLPTGAGNRTLEAWVMLETLPTGGSTVYFIDMGGGAVNNSEFNLAITESSGAYYGFCDYYNRATTGTVDLKPKVGEWTFWSLTYDGTDLRYYKNGVLMDTVADGGTVNTSNSVVGVSGRTNNVDEGKIDGAIRAVRVFTDIRTQSEILSDALETGSVSDANLAAEWLFNNAYTDGSGNGNTLTASGSPVFAKWANHIAGGLVSHYELEESSGTRVDSHKSNDLADNNTVTSATGKQGTAAQFVRANSEYLSITDTADLDLINKFSISTWFYLDTATTGAAYVIASKKGAGSTRQYVLKVSSAGTIALQASSTGVSFDRDTNVSWTETTEAWHHLVLTWDDGNVSYYLNGILLSVESAGGTSIADSTGDFNIGREATATDHFNGRIDEFMVYKYRVLDYGDVLNLYNGGTGISYVGGTAYTSDLTESVNATDDTDLETSKNLTESIIAAATIILNTGKALVESVTATASGVITLILNKALTESVTATVTASAKITVKYISESVTATANIVRSLTRGITESVTASDTIANALSYVKSLTESVTTNATATAKITAKILTESVAVNAVISTIKDFSKTLTESVTVAVTMARSTGKAITNSVSTNATLAKVLTATRSFTESVNVRARLYGLLNSVNMLWNNKYVDKAGTWINKYLDNK